MNVRDRVQVVYHRLHRFIRHDIWLIDALGLRGIVLHQLRIVLIVLRGFFFDHHCLLRAAALTYTTLLALVPMLAFMFAFLKGLGVQNKLEPLLLEHLPVTAEDTVRIIFQYVNNIKVGTLGAIGLGTLLFTTILQLGNVESSFNEIWGIRTGRTLLRKITDYVSVMVIAPVVLFVALGVNATLQQQTILKTLLEQRVIGDAVVLIFTLLPSVVIWLAFTFFYAYLPNTRVNIVPALVGGFIGGMLWQAAQWIYIDFQIGVANLQAIYGAFAQLPMLMIWIYISWVVTLLGAEITFASQNAATYPLERLTRASSFYVKEWLANALYFSLIRTFVAGAGAWSAQDFAQQNGIPIRLLREILTVLEDEQLLVQAATAPEHYVPGRYPDSITPWHILRALRHHGDPDMETLITLRDPHATMLSTRVEESMQQAAGERSVIQWLADLEPTTRPERRP
ncbi:MAG: YihY/virulence factor BrkB family protein [bacterium]|nr:YihY/virulence factor BrkB family protein [bacterium]